jgi:hypothetical protein
LAALEAAAVAAATAAAAAAVAAAATDAALSGEPEPTESDAGQAKAVHTKPAEPDSKGPKREESPDGSIDVAASAPALERTTSSAAISRTGRVFLDPDERPIVTAAPKTRADDDLDAILAPKKSGGAWLWVAAAAAIGFGAWTMTRSDQRESGPVARAQTKPKLGPSAAPRTTPEPPPTLAAPDDRPAALADRPTPPVTVAEPSTPDAAIPTTPAAAPAGLGAAGAKETKAPKKPKASPPVDKRSAAELLAAARAASIRGAHREALSLAKKSDVKLRSDESALVAGIAACNLREGPTARKYAARVNGKDVHRLRAVCQNAGVRLGNAGGAPVASSPDDSTPVPQKPKATQPPPEDDRTAAELLADARKASFGGNPSRAYSLAEKSHKKGGGDDALLLMGVSACKMGSAKKAKAVIAKLPGAKRDGVRSICEQRGVSVD